MKSREAPPPLTVDLDEDEARRGTDDDKENDESSRRPIARHRSGVLLTRTPFPAESRPLPAVLRELELVECLR